RALADEEIASLAPTSPRSSRPLIPTSVSGNSSSGASGPLAGSLRGWTPSNMFNHSPQELQGDSVFVIASLKLVARTYPLNPEFVAAKGLIGALILVSRCRGITAPHSETQFVWHPLD